ncbi:hypothetical protein MPLB_1870022 [Mesorhizobium sp. ORS 3324]|nr:hypothetical protein MPLB_1870022 [Mesorhizobium sp. ORS 3324]
MNVLFRSSAPWAGAPMVISLRTRQGLLKAVEGLAIAFVARLVTPLAINLIPEHRNETATDTLWLTGRIQPSSLHRSRRQACYCWRSSVVDRAEKSVADCLPAWRRRHLGQQACLAASFATKSEK